MLKKLSDKLFGKKIDHVTVIVNPHFRTGARPNFKTPVRLNRFREALPAELLQLTRDEYFHEEHNDIAVTHLEHLQAMKRFYENEIKRLKQTPKSMLVIMANKHDNVAENLDSMIERGISKAMAMRIHEHAKNYQDELIEHANKELGEDNVIVTNLDPAAVAKKLRKVLEDKKIKLTGLHDIEIFGEYLKGDVRVVNTGMQRERLGKIKFNARINLDKTKDPTYKL